ncbi:Probable pseudouridine-5'-phosphatase [Galdieria sulphuraria]|uniref:Beta-phosphoglucomutase isoform 1 n=1 Tax=Galdieria sulphuraria TaxID=130081 RepID=M2Y9C3_GALSU|nr:beta-phosphoglucomutase isoform 1 [Galdieria sulphuraria]EME32688.1 beta-phosphoglucomutase isoform 1 [Galdieria sulphuraria]GJD07890.1 Probable pseudouridine-5'-phosphatase [Galdieria sulphuraria]|eukprot:XP_005709208.1 beta-phosphoglucomutase isoform 1 [Galdieria sulphuraria]
MSEPILAAIWDLDGTLLNTESIYLQVENQTIEKYGGKGDVSTVAHKLLGTPGLDCARVIVDHFCLNTSPEQYLSTRDEVLVDKFTSTQFCEGALELVKLFASYGVRQSIATSSGSFLTQLKLSAHKSIVDAYIDHVICREDVTYGKPFPDIFLLAAKKMGMTPKNCVVLEDAPNGVVAAKRAGMRCVGIRNSLLTSEHYRDADWIVDSLQKWQVEELLKDINRMGHLKLFE